MTIAERLKQLRAEYGVTQHQLALLTGEGQPRIARSELASHEHTLRLTTIFKIADAYSLSPRTVLLGVSINDAPALVDNDKGGKRYWE